VKYSGIVTHEVTSAIRLGELKKYLKTYALSENNYDKREFALELLVKLGAGIDATQSPEEKSVPSVGQQTIPG
jgi:iron uptake system EfeUOB component EfeO/EfeM